MKTKKFLVISAAAVGMSASPVALAAGAPAPILSLARAVFYQQSSATAVNLDTSKPYAFNTNANEIPAGTLDHIELRLPNTGQFNIDPVNYGGPTDEFNFEGTYANLTAFNSTFPAGNYYVSLVPRNGATVNIPLSIAALTFPPVPSVTNYFACQNIAAGSSFTVKWGSFSGATANDRVILQVRSNDDYSYFETPDPSNVNALPGTATSVVIPANTLPPGVDVSAQLIFAKVAAKGASGGVAYFSGAGTLTTLKLHTAGTPDTTAPTVKYANPANNATGVSFTAPMRITFSEPMRTHSGWSVNFGGIGSAMPGVTWSSSTVLTITPPPMGWPPNTKVSFTLNPANQGDPMTDLSGNPLATRTLSFTTAVN